MGSHRCFHSGWSPFCLLLPSHMVPAPSTVSNSLKPLLEELDQKELERCAIVRENYEARKVSFSNQGIGMDDLPNIKTLSVIGHAHSNTGQDSMRCKAQVGNATSTPVDVGQSNVLKIETDLKTEIGSYVGDASEFDQEVFDGDGNLTTLPVHARIPDYVPVTKQDMERELAKNMAEYLVQAALLAGAKDNISVLVVLLKGSGV